MLNAVDGRRILTDYFDGTLLRPLLLYYCCLEKSVTYITEKNPVLHLAFMNYL